MPNGEDLAQLVTTARELRCMTGSGRLYEDVQLVDGMVRFSIRLDPAPEYGAANIARGLVSYLFVVPRRHVAGFSDLTDVEAGAIGIAISRWSRALESAGAERVYVVRIGHGVSHLHVHRIPRWPETPSEVAWMHVDDWDGARRVDTAAAANFVSDLREISSHTPSPSQ